MYISTGLSEVRTVPRLLGKELQPPAGTFYVEINLDLGKLAKPITGIFFPVGFRPVPQVDLILYLHGYKKDQNERWYPNLAIDQYWTNSSFPFYYFPLREGVSDCGKNAVLVAPTLGPKSEAGNLIGEFDRYLDQVISAIATYGPFQNKNQSAQLGNIILASHSGGGSPMLRIATSKNRYAANISECWGFDCLYSGYKDNIRKPENKLFTQPERWIKWAKFNPAKKLFIYYQASTRRESEYLRDQANARNVHNISVEQSKKAQNHFWVPITHWRDRLRSALSLSNR